MGFLPAYINASFNTLDNRASSELKNFVKDFKLLVKKDFKIKKPNIYLYGDYRVGKTWILHAAGRYIVDNKIENSLYYVTVPKLYEYHVKNSYNYDYDCSWVDFLSSRRLLILDDLGQEYRGAKSGYAETIIETFLRFRFNYNRITFIGTNADFDSLESLYGKSLSNFIYGEYIDFEISEGVNMSSILLEDKYK